MTSRIPPFFDLFPEDGLTHPFGDSGEGLRFVYLSNRNTVSHLIAEHREGPEFGQALLHRVPMGYSTLFVLRKLACFSRLKPGEASPYRGASKPIQIRSLSPSFAVLHDPRRTSIGGQNMVHPIATMAECKERAREITAKTGVRTLAVVVEESWSWH